jgi:hypothetical protein
MAARYDLAANPNDPYVTRKTVNTTTNRPKVVQSDKSNVLNKYRSSTYNFSLSALRKDIVNDPKQYRNSTLDFVIIQSGGKGTQGVSTNVSAVDRVVGTEEIVTREGGRVLTRQKKNIIKQDFSGKDLVSSFNKNSPGRFDMFIDNVEIETLMAFSKEGGSTMPTTIKFKINEPYSINGFIEALHVSAVAAGYPSYAEASYLLKMDFVGYPDDDVRSFKGPTVIENSTRYFPIKFTGIEVEVGEKGTTYRCSAIPWSDAAFGQANVLKRPITMAGKKVADILKDFANKLNEQIADDDKKAKTSENSKIHDEYEIVFPVRTNNGFDYNLTNEIGGSDLETILRDSAIFKFPDPGKPQQTQTPQQKDAAPEEVKLHPSVGTPPQIQFAEKQNINEIISAVIRDSEYVKKILKQKKVDPNGFIDYFAIKADVTNKFEIDAVSRKPFQKFRYSIIPYKVHFTKIPSLADQKYLADNITRLSLREYNYIYTGKNVDILNFKLNFNTLFFEAMPAALSNNDQPGSRDAAGQSNDNKTQLTGTNIANQQTDQNPTGTIKQVALNTIMDGANASQRSDDPYYNLARNMHSAIIDSKASMLTGEIDILGDPFYLVTGGIGNYDSTPSGVQGLTTDGEADHLQGEVLVTINFRNPIDIQPLNKGGTLYFESEKLPFSGVYRVLKVQNTFNEGVFKQRLEIIRYPGQIIGKTKETIVADTSQDAPKEGAQELPSTTAGVNQGGTPVSEADAMDLKMRGLPSPGLPGVLSNFTGAIGGLGGQVTNLLTQVSGAVTKGLNGLAGANSVFGGSIPGGVDQLASGIRMKASGLISSVQAGAASVIQAGKTLESSFSVNGAASSLALDITNKATAAANLIAIKGSGIGEGASILVNKSLSSISSQVSDSTVAASDLIKTTAQLPTDITLITGKIKDLSASALSSVSSLGQADASKIISNVGNKITSLTSGLPTDPTAIAAKFGINPSQLSGLGGNLQSKVLSQLETLSKNIPEDTDLSIATAKGLSLNYVPSDKIKNIPATTSYLIAPKPELDQKFLAEITKTGGPQALANAFGVSDVKNISANLLPTESVTSLLTQVSSGIKNPLSSLSGNLNLPDVSALGSKLTGAKDLLNSVSPKLGSVESNLTSIASKVGNAGAEIRSLSNSVSSKFGSITAGTSPLDKLFNG